MCFLLNLCNKAHSGELACVKPRVTINMTMQFTVWKHWKKSRNTVEAKAQGTWEKMIGRGGGKPYKIRLNKQANNDILSHMYSEDGVFRQLERKRLKYIHVHPNSLTSQYGWLRKELCWLCLCWQNFAMIGPRHKLPPCRADKGWTRRPLPRGSPWPTSPAWIFLISPIPEISLSGGRRMFKLYHAVALIGFPPLFEQYRQAAKSRIVSPRIAKNYSKYSLWIWMFKIPEMTLIVSGS